MTSPITDLLDYHLRARHTPGVLVHVERAGRTLARQVAGRIRPDEEAPLHDGVRFRIASLTKPMVTVAALMLVEQIDGVPLGLALQRRLFEPLGMRHTSFEQRPGEAVPLAHPEDAAWHATVPAIGVRQPGQPWMDSGGGGLLSTLDDVLAFGRMLAQRGQVAGQRLLSERLFAELSRNQLPPGVTGPAGYCGSGFGFGLGLAVRNDWGPAAMPCTAGELTWSGISGTALFVQPRDQWLAVMFSSNMTSRMVARLEFRRAASLLA